MSIPKKPVCDSCYDSNSCADRNTGGCSGCNVCDSTCQTICEVGYQAIKDHQDVGDFVWREVVAKEDLIKEVITANNWNKLIEKLESAEAVGERVRQGSAGSASSVNYNDVFLAKHYNEIQKKLSGFEDGFFETVNKNDLITAARINAIRNSYLKAKFKSTVCDICNQGENDCTCNCPCSCDCTCACYCYCPCPCSCNCNCSCGGNCSCGNNT